MSTNNAAAANTNGVISRYDDNDAIGVNNAEINPITIAATNVTQIELNRAINAADNELITKNVNVVASNATRSPSRIPATPDRIPQPNHAAASTRRTGTPNVAVISRSFAIARIAVP
ncbi:MAG TPA: hypothetical protein VHW04_15630, partial [Solirubrobacteraceae bacterium]|nr:hypothetical protein [Solirubrobacteraceae bacterium]